MSRWALSNLRGRFEDWRWSSGVNRYHRHIMRHPDELFRPAWLHWSGDQLAAFKKAYPNHYKCLEANFPRRTS